MFWLYLFLAWLFASIICGLLFGALVRFGRGGKED